MTARGRQPEDLQKVLDITRRMAAASDLDELLALMIDRAIELLDAERASLFLYRPETNELVSRIAAEADEISFPADRGIAGAAITEGRTLIVPDAQADPRFNPDIDRRTGFRTRNILAVPLRDFQGKLVGVLQVLNKREGGFDEHDLGLAETLAAQAGVSLQRALLMDHFARKQEMERAMRIARDIQQGLLPSGPPSISGYDIAGFSRPADQTGGDFYDFVALDEGRWMFVVADVTGHGIGPALLASEARAVLRAFARVGGSAADILHAANCLLMEDLEGNFVTCFLGILDPGSHTLNYASAGHGPMLFYERGSDSFSQANATVPPMGVTDAIRPEQVQWALRPGDMAAIPTDGFFEAANTGGEEFGIERLIGTLGEHLDRSAGEMIAAMSERVRRYTGQSPQADDQTCVIIRRV
jgi:phosphoserine phosphatase